MKKLTDREAAGKKLFRVIRADVHVGNSLQLLVWDMLNADFKEDWMAAAEKLGIKP